MGSTAAATRIATVDRTMLPMRYPGLPRSGRAVVGLFVLVAVLLPVAQGSGFVARMILGSSLVCAGILFGHLSGRRRWSVVVGR